MELVINGKTFETQTNPADMLLWALRDEFGLTGTKFGCGMGICGSCTVHLDGQATRSCITPVAVAEGKAILTIEGLSSLDALGHETLHPVQEAFIAEQVPQCAWCMNGQMMTALAFLQDHPEPSEEDIIEAMSHNYCRCGCYGRIKAAVAKAAVLMKEAG